MVPSKFKILLFSGEGQLNQCKILLLPRSKNSAKGKNEVLTERSWSGDKQAGRCTSRVASQRLWWKEQALRIHSARGYEESVSYMHLEIPSAWWRHLCVPEHTVHSHSHPCGGLPCRQGRRRALHIQGFGSKKKSPFLFPGSNLITMWKNPETENVWVQFPALSFIGMWPYISG